MRFGIWGLTGLLCMLPITGATQERVAYSYDTLGRLVTTSNTSGPSTGTDVIAAYDPAGNRSTYRVTTATTANRPPVAGSDSYVVTCRSIGVVLVLDNDGDPDGDALTIASVTRISGSVVAFVGGNGSNINITGGRTPGETSLFDYVIRDARGLTATGRLTVQTVGSPQLCA